MHIRHADIAAVVSLATPPVTWLSTTNEIVQLLAGIVAIISGLAAAVYYIKNWKKKG